MPNPNAGYQEELFREFSQSGTSQKRNLLSRQDLFSAKTVSFEQILFAAIGGLIALVIAFSFGVERGKSITGSYENPVAEILTVAPALPAVEKITAKEEKRQETKEAALKEVSAQKDAQKGYTIQVASYK